MQGSIKGRRLGSCGNVVQCGKIYNAPCCCMCQTLFLRALHGLTHGALIKPHFTEEEIRMANPMRNT